MIMGPFNQHGKLNLQVMNEYIEINRLMEGRIVVTIEDLPETGSIMSSREVLITGCWWRVSDARLRDKPGHRQQPAAAYLHIRCAVIIVNPRIAW